MRTWLLILLLLNGGVVLADEAAADESADKPVTQQIKDGAQETWQGFKQGLKDTGRAFQEVGTAIKEDAKASADKAKKDFSD